MSIELTFQKIYRKLTVERAHVQAYVPLQRRCSMSRYTFPRVSFAEYSLIYEALLQIYRKLTVESTCVQECLPSQHRCSMSRYTIPRVSFAEYSLIYRALLQKRPMFEGSLPIVGTAWTFSRGSSPLNLLYTMTTQLTFWDCPPVQHGWSWWRYSGCPCIAAVPYLTPHSRFSADPWVSHATHISGSCHTYKWVMSRFWARYVIHISESPYKVFCVPLYSRSALIDPDIVLENPEISCRFLNVSCHTCEQVISHV